MNKLIAIAIKGKLICNAESIIIAYFNHIIKITTIYFIFSEFSSKNDFNSIKSVGKGASKAIRSPVLG